MGIFTMPVQAYFILNPLFIFLLSPILIKFYKYLEKKGIEFGIIKRIGASLIIICLCYSLLCIISYLLGLNPTNKINIVWVIIFELLLAVSELFLTVTGFVVVAQLSPKKYFALFFGFFTATKAIGAYFSGILCQLFPESITSDVSISFISMNTLMGYFSIFVFITFIGAFVLFAYRKDLEAKIHLEED
jgi:POT family proton-dependent oligopeptide transporter